MKKTILLTMFVLFLGQSVYAKNVFHNGYSESDKKKEKKELTFSKKEALTILHDFTSITGDTEFNLHKYLDSAQKDPNWIKANVAFFKERRDVTFPKDYPNKKFKSKIPKWKEALEFYYKSVEERGNILSAYLGLSLINKHFGMFTPRTGMPASISDKVIKKFLPLFARTLRQKGYCYGYLYETRYYVDYQNDIEQALALGEIGTKVCKKQLGEKLIPYWLDLNLRKEVVRAKSIQYVRHEKSKLKY